LIFFICDRENALPSTHRLDTSGLLCPRLNTEKGPFPLDAWVCLSGMGKSAEVTHILPFVQNIRNVDAKELRNGLDEVLSGFTETVERRGLVDP